MQRLEDIGFYTLSDYRAANVSKYSDLQRCELILTNRCNFNCKYCRGMLKEDKKDMGLAEAFHTVNLWGRGRLKNIRFSGGEPTLWPHLNQIVRHARSWNIENIALSTNGSANFDVYEHLIMYGVNDFSISLDSCCSSTGDMMAGKDNIWEKVTNNIRDLSKLVYVTVGVVLTDDNISELNDIIAFASSLGVADIRIIPAAQISKRLSNLNIEQKYLDKHPILAYRYQNFIDQKPVRGLDKTDNHQCPMVLDDMAVMNGKHYPCIIYMREHGKEIGSIKLHDQSTQDIVDEREAWYKTHNCFEDRICTNNCLDVCVQYNNTVKRLNEGL